MATRLRAVLVGCGGISGAWLKALRDLPDVELVGLVDLDEGAARRRAAEYNLEGATIGADLAAMLDRLAPDAVFNCTVPAAHVEVTRAALERGCHVLGEKPLADTMAGARELVAAAQALGKIFAVIQNRRYNANIRRLQRFLQSGAIGPLTTVKSDFFIGAHFGGFRDRMAHVLLLDMAIHTFDAARFLTGADPASVYCKEWNPAGSWYARDASAVAIFELTGGLVYTYQGSWCAEGANTSWESAWRFIGERGSLTWDGGDGFQAQVVTETGGFRSSFAEVAVPPASDADLAAGESHADVIRDFVACIRTGATPQTVCTDNIRSLAMVFGAIESATANRAIQIEW